MNSVMEFKAINLKGATIRGGYYTDGKKAYVVQINNKNTTLWNLSNSNCIGFWTGLKDINNNKIFTNDYVQMSCNNEFNNMKGIVKFYKGRCIVLTDIGFFDLNERSFKVDYTSFGNVTQYYDELSREMKDLLIDMVGIE